MMFRGSRSYGAGEIDALTQSMGGSNNAFTSHDCALYQFSFASDRWQTALRLEADRMRGLLLDPELFEAERSVILEEISWHEDDPWDSLEQTVFAKLYGGHPYSKPILGTHGTVKRITLERLREFHERFYTPENAVLVIAGDVGRDALDKVALEFGHLSPGAGAPSAAPASPVPRAASRLRRSKGEISRLLLAMPGPAATEEDFASLRLAAGVLGLGRASRLHRKLVDEDPMLSSVSVDVTETLVGGAFLVAAEVLPGVGESQVDESIRRELEELAESPPSEEELSRVKRLVFNDWVFSHQQTHQRATTAAVAIGLFGDGYLMNQLRALRRAVPADIRRVSATYLRPADVGITGWSRAEESDR
jgi:zinc protease